MTESHLLIGVAHPRCDPRPRAEMPGAWEAADLADLGDDQHRRVGANPADLAEHRDALVGLGARLDLPSRRRELAVEVIDQRKDALDSPAGRLAQLQASQELSPGAPEQVCVVVAHALARERRMHPVLQRRAHLCQSDPVAQQLTEITQLPGGDVGLRQHSRTKQLRERPRVDRVSLHARRSDGPRPRRMSQVQLIAAVLEQLGEPLPAIGRLHRDLALTLQASEQLEELLTAIRDPLRQKQLALLIDHRDMRTATMKINPNSGHESASRKRGRATSSTAIDPAPDAPESRLLHDIKAAPPGPPSAGPDGPALTEPDPSAERSVRSAGMALPTIGHTDRAREAGR